MTGLVWVAGLVRRRPLRVAGAAAGVMVAVALLASIGAFLSSAKAAMTTHAASSVAVDWQVKTAAGTRSVPAALAATPGVRAAQPVDFAAVDGFTASVGGSVQTTGAGYVLGLPRGYRSAFPGEIRTLAGSDQGVLLFQQTAANLHARPGDTVSVAAPGVAAPVRFRVDGVVDLPQEDSLFQKVGAPPGAQPSAPPDNVVLVPGARWDAAFAGLAAARPDRVEHQVHVGLRRGLLPADPTGAYTYVTGAAHNLEARLAGGGVVGDNLGRALDAARSDALYAQILFLLLGVPGAALAGGITAAVTASGADRRRHEQALLRTRGATRAQLGGLALAEAGVVGLVGAAVGLGVAAGIGVAAFGSPTFGASPVSSAAWALGAAGAGLAIAALTVAVPAYRDASGVSVAAARRLVERYRTPLWCRYGLDVLALAGAAAIGWWVTSAGYHLVLAPEGVPSISVNYWALLGPALAWVGLGLLAWRMASGALARGGAVLAFLLRPFSAGLAPTVISSLRRQRRRLATAVTMVALAGAFAGSTAVFNSTYAQQVRVDAQLTNGADVTVTEPPGSGVGPDGATRLAAVPGVRRVEPLQHRFAYVGNDLQDLFGVRPATIAAVTHLEDAYFQGGSAGQLLSRLAARPDGVLVSAETVRDFQLSPGDLLRLRLHDARTGGLRTVAFHYVGVAKEFPTAPKDSFLVANASYVAAQTHSDAVAAFLVDSGSSAPAAVARRIRTVVGTSATVTDVHSATGLAGSSLTAVDLSGLTKVELGFALALAAAASGLLMSLVLAERRRSFTITAALGARGAQVASFARAEAAFVTGAGLLAAAGAAWGLAELLVKVLTGVFDPAPDHLAVPWGYLGVAALLTALAAALAAEATVRSSRTTVAESLRDL